MIWFSPPVPVKAERAGLRYEVNSVEGAAGDLLKWPWGGHKWEMAVRACIAALAGEAPPNEVRAAFVAAADEAGMLLPTIIERKKSGPHGPAIRDEGRA
jgi:hypothetical protein